MYKLKHILLALGACSMCACGSGNARTAQPEADAASGATERQVTFNADSAFAYIEQQTKLGPRVPGSKAWAQCADWLVEKLTELGAVNVTDQHAEVTAYNGDRLPIRNISAQVNPRAPKRVLLMSHWDSRPWADKETDPSKRNKPIDGANDGASGVGVILEIVRNVARQHPAVGVDVLFVDAEDYGRREEDVAEDNDDSWCLGTQYWVTHPTLDAKALRYAVLLDMVGGKDAVFPREYFSEQAAKWVNDRLWSVARQSGYANRFDDRVGGAITDDHIYMNIAGIPTIDLIEINHPQTGAFNPTWHTLDDNIDNIDPQTLKAVGQTVQNLIYKEK